MHTNNITERTLLHLVEGCIAFNRNSQKDLYHHFYGYAYSVCHRFICKEEETIEVINDGFLKIFKEIGNFKPHLPSYGDSLKAWIRRILINTSIDHLRRRKIVTVELNNFTDLHHAIIPSTAFDKIAHDELLKMVAELSPGYRMVFNLYVIDGFTHDEIATMLKISSGTSKSNLAKARINLQKMILKQNQEEAVYDRRAI